MSRLTRTRKRIASREGKKIMKDAMVQKAADEALLARRRALAWKRVGVVLLIICFCLAACVAGIGYVMFSLNDQLKVAREKCR